MSSSQKDLSSQHGWFEKIKILVVIPLIAKGVFHIYALS
jgi:hypothetical protein